jgi:tetratricopeptide (TPR) repeat protein
MTKKSHKKKRSAHKKWLVAGIILVLFAAGTVAVLWYMNTNKPTADTKNQPTREEQLASLAQNADQAAQSKGPTEGAKLYDQAIKDTADQYEKSTLTANKASMYFNSGDYDGALRLALEADKLHPSRAISDLIAQIYEQQGNKAKAADYYAKAATQVKPDEPMAQSDKSYYQARVAELRGTQ